MLTHLPAGLSYNIISHGKPPQAPLPTEWLVVYLILSLPRRAQDLRRPCSVVSDHIGVNNIEEAMSTHIR